MVFLKDLENFGKLTLMPSYPNPLFDPEINKKVTGKRRSAIRKPEDSVQNDHSAESTTTTMTTTPELKPSLEIHEVSKTSLKPLPRRSHTNRPDLVGETYFHLFSLKFLEYRLFFK